MTRIVKRAYFLHLLACVLGVREHVIPTRYEGAIPRDPEFSR